MNIIKTKFPVNGAMESKIGGRSENQDYMDCADTPLGLLVVLCDGMGGGPSGRLASMTVVGEVIRYVQQAESSESPANRLKDAIMSSDQKIMQMVKEDPKLKGMGTTIVCMILNPEKATVAQVGDSRLYQFRFGFKMFKTEDHSLVADLVRAHTLTEEQARLSANANIITRAINGQGLAEPNIYELGYEKHDLFMLCSDGIWGSMKASALTKCVARTKKSPFEIVSSISSKVDELGLTNGGNHDNHSIIILETLSKSQKKIPMSKSVLCSLVVLAIALLACLGFSCRTAYSNAMLSAQLKDTVRFYQSELAGSKDSLKTENNAVNEKINKMEISLRQKDDSISDYKRILAETSRQTKEFVEFCQSYIDYLTSTNSKIDSKEYKKGVDNILLTLKALSLDGIDGASKELEDAIDSLKDARDSEGTNRKKHLNKAKGHLDRIRKILH